TILFGGYVMDDGLRDGTWTYSYASNEWTDMEGDSDPTPTSTPFDPLILAMALPAIAIVVVLIVLVIHRRT
ncbi:MAG: hypothetical protein ThorAB25_26400, partial [Candidatus Thorarchaeota archaeon AB_25]